MKESVDLIIYNIGEIVTPIDSNLKKGRELSELKVIKNGGIAIKNGKIEYVSKSEEILDRYEGKNILNLNNENVLLPGFVDPHTHLIFGGSREEEFLTRLKGESYLNIQKKGGGIYKTQKDTINLVDKLFEITNERIKIGNYYGILSFEIKSGYGLYLDSEIELLKIIYELKRVSRSKIISTFLLHLVPNGVERRSFLRDVIKILPEIKNKNLIDFIDIFIEEGVFSVEESEEILELSQKLGIGITLHIDQFNNLGASKLALKYNVKSLSHLDLTKDDEIDLIKHKKIVGIIFPLERFIFNREEKRGRKLIDMGLPISISTDFNPGTSPSLNFLLILSLSLIREGLSVEEAINASTINSAYALGLEKEIGSIEIGKRADLLIFSLKSYKEIPYYVGMNFIKYVIINGEVIRFDR